jgi:hypothetical protein
VGVHVHVFARLVQNTVKSQGMPSARQVFVPTPLMNTSPTGLREYVEGNDPVHGRMFMTEVFDQLTRPVPTGELRGEDWDRDTPRYVEASSEDEMYELFRERRYTDFLPIVLPTEERVEWMLTGTSHARDEMVGKLRPTIGMEYWHFDVEKVAVNAVMAGAEPKHFPVILALASSGDTGRQSSMSSMGNMVLVNGPIRNEIGMNSGVGAMGPYNQANAVIGRAFGIFSQNLQGGSVPGVSYGGSQGSNYSYNCVTFAENEEASPWEPYHTQHGYSNDESAVTVSYIWGSIWSEYLREYWREKLVAMICGLEPGMGCTLVLDPIVAREFVERGLETKEQIAEWIHENARIPQRRYWDHVLSHFAFVNEVEAGIEPFAGYWKAPPDELIPIFEPDRINIVVAGGETNGHFSIFQGTPLRAKFRTNAGQKVAVSIDAWR